MRIGYLNPGSPSDPLRQRRLEAFRQGLGELGYVEGQNIAIESRWAEGQYDRYPTLAADLVRLKVDVIVAVSGVVTQAAQQATGTIPIVMSLVNDPVGSGLVASLARPGGNVTGLTVMSPDLVGKQLQLLKEVVPKVSLEVGGPQIIGRARHHWRGARMLPVPTAATRLDQSLALEQVRDRTGRRPDRRRPPFLEPRQQLAGPPARMLPLSANVRRL